MLTCYMGTNYDHRQNIFLCLDNEYKIIGKVSFTHFDANFDIELPNISLSLCNVQPVNKAQGRYTYIVIFHKYANQCATYISCVQYNSLLAVGP